MSDVENARARAEALNEPVTRALRSARRAQLWEGLNRYLASEAAHAHRTAASEQKAGTGKEAGEEPKTGEDEKKENRPGSRGPG